MAVLLNVRHEKFAQNLARGMNQTEAYSRAGFNVTSEESAKAAASRLAADASIEERVQEILGKGAKRAEITRARIHEMLLEDRELARANKQVSASIRAAELLGKDLGMFVDRKEIQTTILDGMDDEDLESLEQKLIAAGARSALAGNTEETPRKQDKDVLPGDGTTKAGTVS